MPAYLPMGKQVTENPDEIYIESLYVFFFYFVKSLSIFAGQLVLRGVRRKTLKQEEQEDLYFWSHWWITLLISFLSMNQISSFIPLPAKEGNAL